MIPHPRAFRLLPALLLLPLCGCNVAGWVGDSIRGGQTVAAAYPDLHDQKCAVLVWVDNGVLNDFGALQLDTAKGISSKLASARETKEVKNIDWVSAERIVQFQQNHPDQEFQAAANIAPLLGVTRLIYVEVENFSIHPNDSPDLWRGEMSATLEVVEVANGKGKVVYTERGINAVAPDGCPVEGVPDQNDNVIYHQAVDAFTTEVCKRFVPYEVSADHL